MLPSHAATRAGVLATAPARMSRAVTAHTTRLVRHAAYRSRGAYQGTVVTVGGAR